MVKAVLYIFFLLALALTASGCWYSPCGSVASGDRVAIVDVKGIIIESDQAIEDLEEARKDDDIVAVVVRVDSPGGSVGASQEIARELELIDKIKPVVVSMGDVAASGGYMIAASARKVFANEGTITGSIGVRMEHLNVEQLMNVLKLRPETLKAGKFKDIGSVYRQMTPEERAILQKILDELHEQFKTQVANGRDLKKEFVDSIADGRVFTGVTAKEMGLIDEIGGIVEATKEAAKMAGIEGEPEIQKIEKKNKWWKDLIEGQFDGFFGLTKYFVYKWSPF